MRILRSSLATACLFTCTALVFGSEAPSLGAAEPQTLDLQQAIELALGGNLRHSLQALGPAQGRLTVADAKNRFRLNLRPELTSENEEARDSQGNRTNDTVTFLGVNAERSFTVGTEVEASGGRTLSSGDLGNVTRWSVQISQPLLRRFGRLVNAEPIVAANSALSASERILILQEADLVLSVVIAYQDILRLEQQVSSDEKARDRIELLTRVTAARERIGRATRVDTLRVDLQLGQVRARLEDSLESLELAQTDLAVLMGAELDARFSLLAPPPLGFELPSLDGAVEVALQNRLDYAQALQDAVDRKRAVKIARRGRLPELSAFVRYEDQDRDSVSGGLPQSGQDRVLFGLRAGRDVFRRDSKVDVSRSLLEEAASARRVAITEQVIARSVQQAWLAYRRANSQISILERNVDHARARLDLASRLFRMGRGDNFSVIDAEESFAQAESDRFSGEVNVTVEGYRFLRSLGSLVEAPERLKPAAVVR